MIPALNPEAPPCSLQKRLWVYMCSACMCTCVLCMCTRACVSLCVRMPCALMHACTHVSVHAYVCVPCAHMHVHMCPCRNTYAHTCPCTPACARACVPGVRTCSCMFPCVHACVCYCVSVWGCPRSSFTQIGARHTSLGTGEFSHVQEAETRVLTSPCGKAHGRTCTCPGGTMAKELHPAPHREPRQTLSGTFVTGQFGLKLALF